MAAFTLTVLMVGCGPIALPAEDLDRKAALLTAIEANPTGSIDLRGPLGSDWDRLAIFGPYAPNAQAQEELGFAVDIERLSPWTNTEGGTLFVLADGRRLVDWFGLPSEDLGIYCLRGAFGADDATFEIATDSDGFLELTRSTFPWC